MDIKRYQILKGVIKGIGRNGIELRDGWRIGKDRGHKVTNTSLNELLRNLETYEMTYLNQQLDSTSIYISNPQSASGEVLYCTIRTQQADICTYLTQYLSRESISEMKMG